MLYSSHFYLSRFIFVMCQCSYVCVRLCGAFNPLKQCLQTTHEWYSFIYQFDFPSVYEPFETAALEMRLYSFSSSDLISKWKFQQNNVYLYHLSLLLLPVVVVVINFCYTEFFRAINCDLSTSIRIDWPDFWNHIRNHNTWNTRKTLNLM